MNGPELKNSKLDEFRRVFTKAVKNNDNEFIRLIGFAVFEQFGDDEEFKNVVAPHVDWLIGVFNTSTVEHVYNPNNNN